jgi:hypothetical protein
MAWTNPPAPNSWALGLVPLSRDAWAFLRYFSEKLTGPLLEAMMSWLMFQDSFIERRRSMSIVRGPLFVVKKRRVTSDLSLPSENDVIHPQLPRYFPFSAFTFDPFDPELTAEGLRLSTFHLTAMQIQDCAYF